MKLNLKSKALEQSAILTRREVYYAYYNRNYNLFMNHWRIAELGEEENNFIFRKLWADGRVASYKVPMTETDEMPNGLIIFAPYAPTKFNLYDFPTEATLVNKRGVKFIPSRPLEVNKEVVLGYAQPCLKSVFSIAEFYLKRIVDIEMVIRINLKVQKMPWIVGVTPENERKMKFLWDKLEDDNASLFVDIEDAQNLKALVSGANYNIDKLHELKCTYENELLTYLGVNNLGVNEKKEHLITSEVDSNNSFVEYSGECMTDIITNFVNNMNKYFGTDYHLINNYQIQYEEDESENEEEEEQDA